MKKQDVSAHEDLVQADIARPLARMAARELSQADMAAVAGAMGNATRATGPNGDDPSDPDWDV
jgi:hypothetical protein